MVPAGLGASRGLRVLKLILTCPARCTRVHVACITGAFYHPQSLRSVILREETNLRPGPSGLAERGQEEGEGQLCRPGAGLSWVASCFPAHPSPLPGPLPGALASVVPRPLECEMEATVLYVTFHRSPTSEEGLSAVNHATSYADSLVSRPTLLIM